MGVYSAIVREVINPVYLLKNGSYQQLEFLKEMEKVQYLSRREILQLQFERLKALVTHAYGTCPFYKERFDQSGFNPSKFQSPEDLEKVPELTKSDIQANMGAMISRSFPKETLVRDKTGGSSGNPLVFYYQRDRIDSRHAATVRLEPPRPDLGHEARRAEGPADLRERAPHHLVEASAGRDLDDAELLAPPGKVAQRREGAAEGLEGGRGGVRLIFHEGGEALDVDPPDGQGPELGADARNLPLPARLPRREVAADLVGGGRQGRAEGANRLLEGIQGQAGAVLRRHGGRAPC